MIAGLGVFAVALLLRGVAVHRRTRSGLAMSAFIAALATVIASVVALGLMTPAMAEYVQLVLPLAVAFALINGVVACTMNPWREDGRSERYPAIVQDATVLALVSAMAVLLLQDRISAFGAGAAVVVGLAMKDTLGNLFAGLAIQVEKPFKIGHWVQIGGVDGRVKEVTWRATKIETRLGNFVVVPNAKLADDIITNYSDPTPHTIVEVDIDVPHSIPPNTVKAVIRAAIADITDPVPSTESEILLAAFGESTLTYRVRVWTTDFSATESLSDQIRLSVAYAFRRQRIPPPHDVEVEIQKRAPSSRDDQILAIELTLRATTIFARLEPRALRELAQTTRVLTYGRGEVVVRLGEPGTSMFVVMVGLVSVFLPSSNVEVARIAAHGFFGEISLLTGAVRSASVRAVDDATLLEITSSAFRTITLWDPTVIEQVAAVVAARQIELDERKSELPNIRPDAEATGNLARRVRRFLRFP